MKLISFSIIFPEVGNNQCFAAAFGGAIAKAYEGNEKRIFALILQMVWPSLVAGSTEILTGFTSYVLPGHGRTSF